MLRQRCPPCCNADRHFEARICLSVGSPDAARSSARRVVRKLGGALASLSAPTPLATGSVTSVPAPRPQGGRVLGSWTPEVSNVRQGHHQSQMWFAYCRATRNSRHRLCWPWYGLSEPHLEGGDRSRVRAEVCQLSPATLSRISLSTFREVLGIVFQARESRLKHAATSCAAPLLTYCLSCCHDRPPPVHYIDANARFGCLSHGPKQ